MFSDMLPILYYIINANKPKAPNITTSDQYKVCELRGLKGQYVSMEAI